MRRLVFVVPALCSLLFTGCGGGGGGGPATRTAVFVAGTGDDVTGDGTQASPYRTITRALSDPELSNLLKVRVGAGVYDTAAGESFPLVIPPNVHVEGFAATASDVRIVGGAGHATVVMMQLGSSLNKVRIESFSTAPSARAVQIAAGSSTAPTEVLNCSLVGAGGANRHALAVTANNVVFSVERSSLSAPGASCIAISGTNNVATLSNNTFSDCNYGVHLLATATASMVTVRNNTFNSNLLAAIHVEGGSVDAGTDTSPGGNTFNASPGMVHLRDARTSGQVMQARGNTFVPPAVCGTNIVAVAGAPGWDIGTVCESAVYVDPNVASSGDGSASSPYKTIREALNDGRVPSLPIFLKPGIYSAATGETFPITLTDDVTIQGGGTQPEQVILSGGGADATIFLVSGDRVTLRNFRAVAPHTGSGASRVILISGDNARLENMSVAGTGPTGVPSNAVEVDRAGISVTIDNCKLSASRATGLVVNADAAILVTGTRFENSANGIIVSGPGDGQQVRVRNCRFQAISGIAIQVLKGTLDAGTDDSAGNNTFSDCGIDLADSRPSGARLEAVDNAFSANPPRCGVNIVVSAGSPGWRWRVTGGAEGTCPP